MKRNKIYDRLMGLKVLLNTGQEVLLDVKLDDLIKEIDKDRHKNYDEFECVEDVMDRLDKIDMMLGTIRHDIQYIQKGDFTKPWIKKSDDTAPIKHARSL